MKTLRNSRTKSGNLNENKAGIKVKQKFKQ